MFLSCSEQTKGMYGCRAADMPPRWKRLPTGKGRRKRNHWRLLIMINTKQEWIPDQQSSYRVLEHSVVKQWRKLAFCFIIMATCNVCILHSAMKTKKLNMTRFTEREKKAPRRCIVCCDKEQYLTCKTHPASVPVACSVCLLSLTSCLKIFHVVLRYKKYSYVLCIFIVSFGVTVPETVIYLCA